MVKVTAFDMESNDKPHKHRQYGNMYVIAHVIALITAYAARHCVQRSCIDMCLLFFLIGVAFFQIFILHPIQSGTGAIGVHAYLLADTRPIHIKLEDL